ncbi:MAG: phosphoribosylaminoimidazolesuccinocarboxamide synthase [Acidimicrobiia bacterium]
MPDLPHIASGKVREIYEIDPERLLFVATDRISAFDVVFDDPIPDKGAVLTGLSAFWFRHLDVAHHLLTTDLADVPGLTDDERVALAPRSMVVRRAEVIPLECVVRGYLYGSSWKEYEAGGGPTTEHLPSGLRQADRLHEPIFTPATKAETGHDLNLTEVAARFEVGDRLFERLRTTSVRLYLEAHAHAAERGLILADTKFEFGVVDGEVILVDEALTPDSSRYWPANEWVPGRPIPSFDKQFVRDWAESTNWDKEPPAPRLPAEVAAATRARYVEAFERITGRSFNDHLEQA